MTYMDCKFFYRDQRVEQEAVAQYKVGCLFAERAYVDSSKLRGGMPQGCNLRYLIFSNQGADLSQFNADAKRLGLVVFARNLVWKVMDKYTIGETTQILISPDVMNDKTASEIVEAARSNFDELYRVAPVTILNADEWKKRLFFPVGLNDENIPFSR